MNKLKLDLYDSNSRNGDGVFVYRINHIEDDVKISTYALDVNMCSVYSNYACIDVLLRDEDACSMSYITNAIFNLQNEVPYNEKENIKRWIVVPHFLGNNISLSKQADVVSYLNVLPNVDIVGLFYTDTAFFARCITENKWCWQKPVHLFISDINTVPQHRDLFRICQNIKSIQTYEVSRISYEYNTLIYFENGRFGYHETEKLVDITMGYETCLHKNYNLFCEVIADLTNGCPKIAIVGAAGIGKTTLAKTLNNLIPNSTYLKYPRIKCENQSALTAMYVGCNYLLNDMANKNQCTTIMDRCLLDNVVYAEYQKDETMQSICNELWDEAKDSYSTIIYLKPLTNENITNDGYRETNKTIQSEIDDLYNLKIVNFQYYNSKVRFVVVYIDELNERIETILKKI